jgi:general nucleoside transport system permease protein
MLLKEILATSATRIALSIVVGFLIGALFIFFASDGTWELLSGGDILGGLASGVSAIGEGYAALLRGAVYNTNSSDIATGLRPLTETIRFAGPLIAAGLGVSLGFRVGLFNIGGTGQILFGILWATVISTRLEMPFGVHVLVAVIAAIMGASLYGALVGFLKARTGAHEVILTIMLNYVAIYLFTWFIRSPNLLQDPTAGGTPKAEAPAVTAQLPVLLPGYQMHAGLFLVIGAIFAYWWLMERSAIGFRFRMVGQNPHAARTAGINVENTYIWAMASSAALVGVAAAHQGLGIRTGFTYSIHAGIGFDAITVALLGGGNAIGIAFAGLLFGAFKAGGPQMQVIGVSPEVLSIVQASIVLFIAAPPLIRAAFRLPVVQESPALDRLRAKLFQKGAKK